MSTMVSFFVQLSRFCAEWIGSLVESLTVKLPFKVRVLMYFLAFDFCMHKAYNSALNVQT